MSTSEPKPGEKVKQVRFSDDELIVDLLDGRRISVPLTWYPRLLHATPEQRENWIARMLEESLQPTSFQEGQAVEGKIVALGSDVAFVDVGGKGEATIEIVRDLRRF